MDFPAVGDWVAIEPAAEGADARIRAVLPRSSRFSRRAAGDATEEQIVAANIDTVFLVSGLDGDFNPRRIERYLVVAWDSGATPVIVLNKADLVDDIAAVVEEVRGVAGGVDVHPVSCRRPESLDVLRRYLGRWPDGCAPRFVGRRQVVDRESAHRPRAAAHARGPRVGQQGTARQHRATARHAARTRACSSTRRACASCSCGRPGDAVGGTFADIEERAAECRFRDCQHGTEPGCAVRAAVQAGEIPAFRLESFHKLLGEQAYQARQLDERARLEEKRRGKIGSKALQKRLKDKGRHC